MDKIQVFTVLVGFGLASSASAQTDSTLNRVVTSQTLRVCTTGDYAPFTSLNASKEYEGIDIDLARSLAASLDAKAEFVPSKWATLLDDLGAGRCDIVMGGVSINLVRQRRAYFSIPELTAGKAAIARCADKAKYATLASIDQPGG